MLVGTYGINPGLCVGVGVGGTTLGVAVGGTGVLVGIGVLVGTGVRVGVLVGSGLRLGRHNSGSCTAKFCISQGSAGGVEAGLSLYSTNRPIKGFAHTPPSHNHDTEKKTGPDTGTASPLPASKT